MYAFIIHVFFLHGTCEGGLYESPVDALLSLPLVPLHNIGSQVPDFYLERGAELVALTVLFFLHAPGVSTLPT